LLEYCPGTKINDAATLDKLGLDRQRLARLSVESYLQQILVHGLFHAGVCVCVCVVWCACEWGPCVCCAAANELASCVAAAAQTRTPATWLSTTLDASFTTISE
jgi:hypothetical protein